MLVMGGKGWTFGVMSRPQGLTYTFTQVAVFKALTAMMGHGVKVNPRDFGSLNLSSILSALVESNYQH